MAQAAVSWVLRAQTTNTLILTHQFFNHSQKGPFLNTCDFGQIVLVYVKILLAWVQFCFILSYF